VNLKKDISIPVTAVRNNSGTFQVISSTISRIDAPTMQRIRTGKEENELRLLLMTY
jgi:hypothetical protein